MTGGFVRSADLLASEYGWKRLEILDTPICTIRALLEVIKQRKKDEAKLELKIAEWSTRILASFMVNTAQVTEKGHRSLMKEVAKIALGLDAPAEEAKAPIDRTAPGSYEALMKMAGG